MGIFHNIGTVFDFIFNNEEYKDKGSTGERFLYRYLEDEFFSKQLLRNVYITKENGETTEIDLLTEQDFLLCLL